MLLSEVSQKVSLTHVAGPQASAFEGVYVGDLLSRAMSRVQADCLWITIMNNINVIAVASLADAAAVVLAEGVTLTPEALAAAQDKEISVYQSDASAYEICAAVAALTGGAV